MRFTMDKGRVDFMNHRFLASIIAVCVTFLGAKMAVAAMSGDDFIELCKSGTPYEVAAAIEGGADVNARDYKGRTPLMWTVYFSSEDHDIIPLILKGGADVNARDEEGKTALILASDSGDPQKAFILLKNGALVNERDNEGWTALMNAAAFNANPEIVSVLLEGGADINAADNEGWTALMRAADRNKNPEVMLILLRNKADANIRNKDGKRAIDYADEDIN
jgi:ankyrin repeat protein